MTDDVNRDPVVAEVWAVFSDYERALVANDTERLNELFWASPLVVRFGVADAQVGHHEVTEWRAGQAALPPGRTLHDTRVAAFGDDVAVVTTRFTYPGRPATGRQTQTWVRRPEGWRIVSAHVSEIVED